MMLHVLISALMTSSTEWTELVYTLPRVQKPYMTELITDVVMSLFFCIVPNCLPRGSFFFFICLAQQG